MKKIQTIIVASVLALSMVLSGSVFADGQGKGHRHGFGFKQPRGGDGLMLLVKYQQKNMRIQVLSEMTGQSTEAIVAKLKEQRMPTVMQELGVDREAFRTAMRIKAIDLIQSSAESGSITPEQAKKILAKMQTRSKRHELISKLIEKGIADGTITREDAQLLLRKRR